MKKVEEKMEELTVHSESKKRPPEISHESDIGDDEDEDDEEEEDEDEDDEEEEDEDDDDEEDEDDDDDDEDDEDYEEDEEDYVPECLIRSKIVGPREYNFEAESGEESPSDCEEEKDIEFEKKKESLSFEEREAKYLDEIESSDGFFVSDYPYKLGEVFGGIRRQPNNSCYERIRHFCRVAVQLHNKLKPENEHLKFVKLLYSTYHGCAGWMYFLTFRAKKLSTGEIDDYQAKLWTGLDYDTLLIFRRKPPQENKKDIDAASGSSSIVDSV